MQQLKEKAISKEWTQQYLRECMKEEARLASLMPARSKLRYVVPSSDLDLYTKLRQDGRSGMPMVSTGHARLSFSAPAPVGAPPLWRRNWDAAGELSVELGLAINHDKEDASVSVSAGGRRRNVTERYEDHPSKVAATWAAIVGAAIQLLEAQSAL